MTPPPEESTLRKNEILWDKISDINDKWAHHERPCTHHIDEIKALILERERLARIDEITNSYDLTDHKDKRLKDLGKQAVKGDK